MGYIPPPPPGPPPRRIIEGVRILSPEENMLPTQGTSGQVLCCEGGRPVWKPIPQAPQANPELVLQCGACGTKHPANTKRCDACGCSHRMNEIEKPALEVSVAPRKDYGSVIRRLLSPITGGTESSGPC